MAAEALVAVCHSRPLNCGHVGWGYELPNGQWHVGAVEGVGWQGTANGFWGVRANNLDHALSVFASMAQHDAPYDNAAILRVDSQVTPNPKYADSVAAWVSRQKYDLFSRNCMDSTYDVLQAFAVGYVGGWLPKPEDNWFPNDFYKNLPAVQRVSLRGYLETEVPALSELLGHEPSAEEQQPEWRDPASPNYLPAAHESMRNLLAT